MNWSIVIPIVALIGFFCLLYLWKKSKGKRGEKRMAAFLSFLPKKEYRIINDLLLQSGGHSTQIDHVVVSVYGVFVIETKYYQGWIYGGENSEFWTQNIYGTKNQLRNPLWQNQGHIKAIMRLIDEPGMIPIYNIVAFSSQATLKIDRSLPVLYWRQVVRYIKSYKEPVMSQAYAEEIYKTLLAANVTDKAARKAHVKSVKQNVKRRNTAVSNGKCPRCGGNLVLRDGKYGKFYGCSNYPNCSYTLNQ